MAYYGRASLMGDPGFLSSLGSVFKGATVGLLTGGPAGALLGAAGGLVGQQMAGTPQANTALLSSRPPSIYTGQMAYTQSPGPPVPTPGTTYPQLPAIPGRLPGSTAGVPMIPAQAGGGCPKGYRPNKTGYFLKSGMYVAPGTKCVRYRTRNNLNQRALRRSISRVQGFEKLVKRSRSSLRSLAKV